MVANGNGFTKIYMDVFITVVDSMCLFYSCHSKDPTIAVLPTKDPGLGDNTVIRLFGGSKAVLSIAR